MIRRQPGFRDFTDLVGIMDALRSERGCPWDKEQSEATLVTYLLEETHELIEAVEGGNPEKTCEELGDVMFQLLFFARIAKENGKFDIYDVIAGICDKMVTRHPHVFGRASCETSAEVLKQWDEIKKSEGRHVESSLSGIPKALPSLLRAYTVQDRASRAGFDWSRITDVFEKLDEELCEFKEAVIKADPVEIENELGNILFTIVNISRFIQLNPEEALRKTINRFIARFGYMERNSTAKTLSDMTIAEMDALWEEAKREGL